MSIVTITNTSKLLGKTTQILFWVSAMAIVTISRASKLVGKTTQTLYRHIRSGILSRSKHGIDTNELRRIYGDFYQEETTEIAPISAKPNSDKSNLDLLQLQIIKLEREIELMKEQHEKREDRLLRIIESKFFELNPEPGFLKRLFK